MKYFHKQICIVMINFFWMANSDYTGCRACPVNKVHSSTLDECTSLTKQGCGVFAKCSSHRWIYRRLTVCCRQLGSCVISTLIVVVLHV